MGGLQDHPGPRFAEFGVLATAGVVADLDTFQGEKLAKPAMDRLDCFTPHFSASDIGLVRDQYQDEVRITQPRASLDDPGQEPELIERMRRTRMPVAEDGGIEGAVPVQKNCGAKRAHLSIARRATWDALR